MSKSGRLESINTLRGLIIIPVVAIHMNALILEEAELYWKWMPSFLGNVTVLFCMISGFLFYEIHKRKELRVKDFWLSKMKNIGLPYLFYSLCAIALKIKSGLLTGSVWDVILSIFSGEVFTVPFYYIPVILTILMLAPIFMKGVQQGWLLGMSLTSLLVALVLGRPFLLEFGENIVYFSAIFILGMAVSAYKKQTFRWLIDPKNLALCSTAVVTLMTLQATYLSDYEFHRYVSTLQKILLFPLLYVFLEKFPKAFGDFGTRVLDKLAQTSFAIFFMHMFIIKGLLMISGGQKFPPLLAQTCLLGGTILLCVIAAEIGKKILKKKAKYIIAY